MKTTFYIAIIALTTHTGTHAAFSPPSLSRVLSCARSLSIGGAAGLHYHEEAKARAVTQAEHLFDILRSAKDKPYLGEDVSQLQHAEQCAYKGHLIGTPDWFVLACLFHDIGHLLPGKAIGKFGTKNHAIIGARFLRKQGFGPKAVALVCSHIDAKRYLLAVDPNYYDRLSEASRETLKHQGKAMTTKEIEIFHQNPLSNLMVELRKCDDRAKDPNAQVPSLETYFAKTVAHILPRVQTEVEAEYTYHGNRVQLAELYE